MAKFLNIPGKFIEIPSFVEMFACRILCGHRGCLEGTVDRGLDATSPVYNCLPWLGGEWTCLELGKGAWVGIVFGLGQAAT